VCIVLLGSALEPEWQRSEGRTELIC